ncbi:hypothetical protein I603_1677 [Erythrobacter dokdonensis DSW-74]|uniref:Uncharacterized protein n=1 Tax=Erythrobacter dokdonensis DSW-74 TaxID=1300349 RepID=A0A1A7BFK2_9SPHN|nr:hypothetical protein I603_1677 [Erythrobacter dokdonensis DSW-74]
MRDAGMALARAGDAVPLGSGSVSAMAVLARRYSKVSLSRSGVVPAN